MDNSKAKYEAEITKKLDAFKNAKEWSDFISLLNSLDSTIKRYAIADVPKKKLLFKRLNQCLNPGLPAGVHNKALETYSLVFGKLSREDFVKEFDFLTLGLFTFSAHSRILVTGSFLDVLEKYIIPLGKCIEKYCKSVLIGLFPPMEFESGEYYNRARLIMMDFRKFVSTDMFYHSLWSIFLNDERLRMSISNYIFDAEKEDVIHDSMKLVSKALCAGLASESALVVRRCLDLLIYVFADTGSIEDGMITCDLVEAVVKLFVKRDLSLNKRIYAWMKLNERACRSDLALLTNVMRRFIARSSAEDMQFFFRILITLQDKGNLCEVIMYNLVFEVLESLRQHSNGDFVSVISGEFLEGHNEKIDVLKIAKVFLTSDLDGMWRIFYMKLRKELIEENECEMVSMNDECISVDGMRLGSVQDRYIESWNTNECIFTDVSQEQKIKCDDRYDAREIMKMQFDTGMRLGCDEMLDIVRYVVEEHVMVDVEVCKYHLPFLTGLVLQNSQQFDFGVLLRFLRLSIEVMKLEEGNPGRQECMQEMVYRFYIEENTELLKFIQPWLLSEISVHLERVIEFDAERLLPLMIEFMKKYGVGVFSNEFMQRYHEIVLNMPAGVIKKHLQVYEMIDINKLDCLIMFETLWERFCMSGKGACLKKKVKQVDEGLNEWRYELDVEVSDVCVASTARSNANADLMKEGLMLHWDCDHWLFAELIWLYNDVFNGEFERFLLEKIGEGQVKEVGCFLIAKIEEFKGEFDFMEVYYVINCKLDAEDSVLDMLLCSLTYFDDIFLYLIRSIERSCMNVSERMINGVSDTNRIFGVLRCIRNLLRHSRRFRNLLRESENLIESKVFLPGANVNAKEMVYRMLVHLLVHKHGCRQMNIEVVQMLEVLVRKGILDGATLNVIDVLRIAEVAKENREDSVIVLGIGSILRHSGNASVICEVCVILDSWCFYYHEMLEYIFSLPDRLQRKIIANVMSMLKNEGFGLMIAREILESMLLKRGVEADLPGVIDRSMGFMFDFFESQYEPDCEDACAKCCVKGKYNIGEGMIDDGVPVNKKCVNARMNILKLKAAKQLSELFFKKVPIKFIERLVEQPCAQLIEVLDFKEQLYASVLNAPSSNAQMFRLLMHLNGLIDKQELMDLFEKSRGMFERVSSYRIGPYYTSLLFGLDTLSRLNMKNNSEPLVLMFLQNSVYFLQKRLDIKCKGGEDCFKDEFELLDAIVGFEDGVLGVMPGMIGVIFTLINSNDAYLREKGIDLLMRVSSEKAEVKYWKREFLEIFHMLDFFSHELHKKTALMRKIVVDDPNVISELILRLDGGFFVSQASDVNNKVLVLKRISYIIFCAPYNHFLGVSLKIVEKIAMLISHTSAKVKKEVLFLSKVLLLKMSHDKLISLYPILFYDVGVTVEEAENEDLALLGEALKLLDVVFLLNTSQLSEISVVFLDFYRKADGMRKGVFSKTEEVLRQAWKIDIDIEEHPMPEKRVPLMMPGKVCRENVLRYMGSAAMYYNWLNVNCCEIDYEHLFSMILDELKEVPE
ncbi:Dopey-like leucine zipper transcription factor [Ordospora colligata]|uniref:Dopey-like leucine zipper transcription factor n=1 Tax=Ordospora colligata OC4 TaxID=1354746 RepID=A0A0B2UJ81_9MICR|nr:Dopey-like leucine zipper transcription factor [Ordospora colligata OC4]KHN69403.1 Dopey-like leucine zipper transcription factor [Ordospora colligata OC4]TBU14917.1 Dopey-like leucine zipper transcription factor [Ordospora colligata]TBU15048.1 Dopey-like leucine zipper transcription factor [Ordospora colligata]TBU18302.1 Dopey-like leucine zipper transcription factor [Ordospora colligata]